MKQLLLIFCVTFLTSCDYFEKKKVYTDDIVEEELKAINWKDVDEYPTFDSCSTSVSKSEKRQCFERTLKDFINDYLSQQNIVVTETIEDTIQLNININNQGLLSIKDIKINPLTKQYIPKIDSLLHHSFDLLPKIYPAIKRGQQVETEFILPIVVKIN
jgi:hypothetical protein